MKKLIEKLKNTRIFEINLINISTMLTSFNFEIFYFIYYDNKDNSLLDRGLFRIAFSTTSLYINLLFIEFCIFDRNGREFFIR